MSWAGSSLHYATLSHLVWLPSSGFRTPGSGGNFTRNYPRAAFYSRARLADRQTLMWHLAFDVFGGQSPARLCFACFPRFPIPVPTWPSTMLSASWHPRCAGICFKFFNDTFRGDWPRLRQPQPQISAAGRWTKAPGLETRSNICKWQTSSHQA